MILNCNGDCVILRWIHIISVLLNLINRILTNFVIYAFLLNIVTAIEPRSQIYESSYLHVVTRNLFATFGMQFLAFFYFFVFSGSEIGLNISFDRI